MSWLRPVYPVILDYWNYFAEQNNLPKVEKLNDKLKNKIRKRMLSQPDFILKMPQVFYDIQANSEGKNIWGDPLTLRSFLSTNEYVRALNKKGVL